MDFCKSNNIILARKFVNKVTNENYRGDRNFTYLISACYLNRFEFVQLIVDNHKNLDINAKCMNGYTAIDYACINESTIILDFLLKSFYGTYYTRYKKLFNLCVDNKLKDTLKFLLENYIDKIEIGDIYYYNKDMIEFFMIHHIMKMTDFNSCVRWNNYNPFNLISKDVFASLDYLENFDDFIVLNKDLISASRNKELIDYVSTII